MFGCVVQVCSEGTKQVTHLFPHPALTTAPIMTGAVAARGYRGPPLQPGPLSVAAAVPAPTPWPPSCRPPTPPCCTAWCCSATSPACSTARCSTRYQPRPSTRTRCRHPATRIQTFPSTSQPPAGPALPAVFLLAATAARPRRTAWRRAGRGGRRERRRGRRESARRRRRCWVA